MKIYIVLLSVLSLASTQDQDSQPTEGQITLGGGTVTGTGNVQIYHEGRWGTVCDDGWDLQAAHVVCMSLGYERALLATRESYFEEPEHDFWLDDVRCYGSENSIKGCEHAQWGVHNCDQREAAGVFCSPQLLSTTSTTTTTTAATTTTTTTTAATDATHRPNRRNKHHKKPKSNDIQDRIESVRTEELHIEGQVQDTSGQHRNHYPAPYEIRLENGRNPQEGRVEVQIDGNWGVICSDTWGLMESMVACRQAGFGYASAAVQVDFFGGDDRDKLLGGLRCDGDEERVEQCYHEHVGDVICSSSSQIAGVICTQDLPDLVPNATLLQESTYLQDRPMYYLQCALEENCASRSAFTLRDKYRDWHLHRRRLLRFSSSTWNFGTADFRPASSKNDWEWHLCHMHYHSMSVFAHYDLLDEHNNRVAQGHKASFCLEDVQCIPDKEKLYQCKGYGDQGISVGCADDYLHDIDCQWIDVTDVPPGQYTFKVHINPEQVVAELDFSNNAVTCDLYYSGYDVTVSNCKLGRG